MPGKGGHLGIKAGAPTIDAAKTKYGHKINMSQSEIAELWIQRGGDVEKADLMSAIAMAESSGITHNGNYCCHGLYGENVEAGVTNMACAIEPVCATDVAIKVSSNGTELKPWESYTNGHYKRFLGKSNVGTGDPVTAAGETAVGAVKTVVSPLTSIVSFIAKLFDPTVWLRIGKAIAGFLLLAFGAITLMKVLVGVDIPTGAVSAGKLAAGLAA